MSRLHSAPVALLTAVLVAAGSLPCRGGEPAAPVAGGATSFLGVSLGLNDLHVRDEYLVPSTERGRLPSAAATYELQLAKTRQTIDLGLSVGDLSSDSGRPPQADTTAHVAYVSYSVARSIRRTQLAGRQLDLSLGGGLSSFVSYQTVGIPANTFWYGADESWYWSHALDVQFRADYRLKATRSLSIRLAAPLTRLVSRPDNGHFYSQRNKTIQHESVLDAAKGGAAELLWDNLGARCEVEYRQRLSDRLGLRASYTFRIFSSETPLSMRGYTNNLLLGVLWQP